MIRPYSHIPVGADVSVELKHGNCLSGIAQWSEKGLTGITFHSSIDVLALLTTSDLEARPRMPRIELSCSASLRHDGDVWRARVVNISQGGMCLKADCDLKPDADVVVSLPDLPPTPGVVKWKEGEHYGIGFNNVFTVSDLMAFLQRQQREGERQSAA